MMNAKVRSEVDPNVAMFDYGRLLSSTECENLKKFSKFYTTFVDSQPSKQARKFKDSSVIEQRTGKYLKKAAIATKPKVYVRPETPFPAHLKFIVDTQSDDGRWEYDEDIEKIISGSMGVMPQPPEGMSLWRWFTALIITYLKRYPEHFKRVGKFVEDGTQWTDEHLLKTAFNALPPESYSLDIDPELIKTGKWKTGMKHLFDEHGSRAFKNMTQERDFTKTLPAIVNPNKTATNPAKGLAIPTTKTTKSTKAIKRQRKLEKLWEKELDNARTAIARDFEVGDFGEISMRKVDRFGTVQPSSEWHPVRIVRVNLNKTLDIAHDTPPYEREMRIPAMWVRRPGVPKKRETLHERQRILGEMARTWSTPTLQKNEIKRLKSTIKSKKRKPFSLRPTPKISKSIKLMETMALRNNPLMDADNNTFDRTYTSVGTLNNNNNSNNTNNTFNYTTNTNNNTWMNNNNTTTLANTNQLPIPTDTDVTLTGGRSLMGGWQTQSTTDWIPHDDDQYDGSSSPLGEFEVKRMSPRATNSPTDDNVVKSMLRVEECLSKLKFELIKAVNQYESAEKQGELLSSFDKFTTMLEDYRGVVMTATEKGEEWSTQMGNPLLWGGVPVFQFLLQSLNFMMESSVLCSWYGKEFHFLGNPLSLHNPHINISSTNPNAAKWWPQMPDAADIPRVQKVTTSLLVGSGIQF
eukprot:TRINITY_DN3_c0_g5_i1.p1 TRINITY_DN3_c0_g5~~TRINITY_DN3_c0_g5_i1.p1  ORF type:complete len:691 (+),score=162.12 TRINITY_DN3_c0_g5_i1:132-2204(+)